MGLYIKQNNRLNHIAGIKSDIVGAVVGFYGTAGDGWLLCDGRDTTGTDEELAVCYPLLYEYLGNTNVLPDLRECVLVGAGQNSTHSIADHDVYKVGQFKDDQMQQHQHAPNGLTGGRIHNNRNAGNKQCEDTISRPNTGTIVDVRRVGTETHTKQIGVNYYIKAE